MEKQNKKITQIAVLLRSIPAIVIILFILAVISMNLLANITILSLPWLALNAGLFVSWLSFLLMDIVTKHFGAKAANIMSLIAITVNTLCSIIFWIISKSGIDPKVAQILGGEWSIYLASTIAFIVSALTNNYTNVAIGKWFKKNPDSKEAYATRSFLSTFISQFIDNFLFVFLAFVLLPLIPTALPVKWTIWQCIGCSFTCAILEFLSEAIFTPFGYKVNQRWKEKEVGKEYLEKYSEDICSN